MTPENNFEHTPLFMTERLSVSHAMDLYLEDQTQLTAEVIELLTPQVVKTLPEEWHNITTAEQALSWLQARFTESDVLMIHDKPSDHVIGFMFTYDSKTEDGHEAVNIGYLLGEGHWRKGYASEVLKGLVEHYKASSEVQMLYAGVEANNVGSIKVLEKTGFTTSRQPPKNDKNLFYELKLN